MRLHLLTPLLPLALLLSCDPAPDAGPGPAKGDSGRDSQRDSERDSGRDSGQDTEQNDSGDTSGDTGDPPPLAACDFSRLSAAPTAAPADPLVVGGFSVASVAAGYLVITHADAGSRQVFAGAGDGWLHAAQGDLRVEEHQGSFEVEEVGGERCREPVIDAAAQGPEGAWLVGRFEDCPGITLQVGLCEPDAGQLRLLISTSDPALDQLTLRMNSTADTKIFGLGEQSPHDTLDLKGREIPIIAQEGGVGRGHEPISTVVNLASPGSAGSEASSYAPAAWLFTDALQAVALENTEVTVVDMEEGAVTELRLYAPAMQARIFQGESPKELITRLTAWTGRQPPLPTWVDEGAIVALARPLAEGLAIVDELQAAGVAISGVWNQTWSGVAETYIGEQVLWNWTQNTTAHPGWDDWVAELDGRGVRTLCYMNPMLVDPADLGQTVDRDLFSEAWAAGYFVHDEAGEVYLQPVTAFEVGLLDLSNPATVTWVESIIQDELIGAGCSGWMADFAEALPFDAAMADGEPAAAWHNRYPVAWSGLHKQAVEDAGLLGEILVFNRSGHTATPGQSILLWQGDQLTTWDKYDGLVSALHGLVGSGLSGVQLNHSDTGGYTSLSLYGLGYDRESELLKRWAEMSAFTAVLRTHEGNQPGYNAQIYDDEASMAHFARMSQVYKALAPYRRELYAEAEQYGWPLVRHLLLEFPDDPTAWEVHNQFLLGPEILVAPIENKCWTTPWCWYDKETYLPPAEWVHLWTGDVYDTTRQGEWVTVSADIGEPAVFYRRDWAGASAFIAALNAAGVSAPDVP